MKLKFRVTAFLQLLGTLLVSFGLIREAFGYGLPPRVIDPRAPQTAVTETIAQAQEIIFHLGGKFTLIPTEHALTATEHRADAALAIAGFFMLVLAAITHVVQRLRGK